MAKGKEVIYYYSDPLHDEFGPSPRTVKAIRGDYAYNRDQWLKKFFDFVSYRLVMTPIAFIYTKLIRRTKIVNRHLLKEMKKMGAIVYANHTHAQGDAFGPTIHLFPKKVSMVVNSANDSLPLIGNLTKSWGALPLPEDYLASKNFLKEVGKRLAAKEVVLIYPEAHLWPYYTLIRPFTAKSFTYPQKYGVKTYALTTTYQTKRNGRLKTVVYLDGPFIVKDELTPSEAAQALRDEVYSAMVTRSKLSTYQKIKYIYTEKKGHESSVCR